MAAPIATAEAPAVNRFSSQTPLDALQQRFDVFGARGGVAPLKLDWLPRARRCSDRQRPQLWVGANDVADEKIPAMKFLQILVDHEADEQIALRLFLFFGWEAVERFGEYFVRRTIGDFLNEILFGF